MRKLILFVLCVLPAPLSARAVAPVTAATQMVAASAKAGPPNAMSFNERFDRAYALFNSGRQNEAVPILEALRKEQPASFKVAELLGLALASQGKIDQAVMHLRAATLLDASSVAAHDNLGTALASKQDWASAEAEWQRARALQPGDATATRDLAKLYLQQDRLQEALPLLRAAHALNPGALDTTYNLALADCLLGNLPESRQLVTELLLRQDAGEYHSLLGRVDEKEAKYVEAAHEFGAAAALDANEDNLFAWGSELLTHRAYEPAVAVFRQGTERFPSAPRLWVGLGMALYSRGEYDPAVLALLKAADLNAEDPRCYVFLSKAYLSAPSEADRVIEQFRRYATLQPNNAKAQYLYALSLWKGKRAATESIDKAAVEALFLRSIALDNTDAETHLQLGIFYNDEHAYEKAMQQFKIAQQLGPEIADVHFRLGRAYLRNGEKEKSEAEFSRFQQLQAEHQAQVDKERAEVQQFVVAMQAPAAAKTTGTQPE